MKKIVLTGGGTAGHVTPNIALLPKLKEEGYEIVYIGSENGIERDLIQKENIPYYSIPTGKLRRYLSVKNISDVFRVVAGIKEASSLLKKIKPDVVFSKGGFVAVPVILGATFHKIPVILHESDMTPGLANKIAMPFAKKVCTTFPETLEFIPKGKGIATGTPIRQELFSGDQEKGLAFCGFSKEKPVLLMMGGSLGSVKINTCLRHILPSLLKDYQVVHLCGKGNFAEKFKNLKGYAQFEYVNEELSHVIAAADVVLSRAGSNAISEFLALKKPMLLVPLSAKASRGDQIINAKSFEKQGFAMVLEEEEMTEKTLEQALREMGEKKVDYIKNMEKSGLSQGVKKVTEVICRYGKNKK